MAIDPRRSVLRETARIRAAIEESQGQTGIISGCFRKTIRGSWQERGSLSRNGNSPTDPGGSE